MSVEVRHGDRRRLAGWVHENGEALSNMTASHRTLVELEKEGLFARLAQGTYHLEFHYRSEADWEEWIGTEDPRLLEADDELLVSTFSHPQGRVVAIEETTITVHERRDPFAPRRA